MIEIADVFRRFAADYVSLHGASMLPSHRRAIKDILACRTAALGGQVWRCDASNTEMFSYHSCRNSFLRQPQLSQVSHRTDPGMAGTAASGTDASTVLPHHCHCAGRTARGAARQPAGWLWRADAGQCRWGSSNLPAIRVTSAASSACSPCCTPHLDPAVELASACPLPGQRRWHLRGRQHLAPGAAEVPDPDQGARQVGAWQVPCVAKAKVP